MENIELKKEEKTAKEIFEELELTQFELTKALYTSAIFSELDLTPSSKLFLWALCTHYNPKKETMFPSQANVAKKLGISTKSAERAVKELSEKGLLKYTTKRVNHYVFGEKFFRLINLSITVRQIVAKRDRQNVGLTNNHEQKNNKKKNFKNSFYFEQNAEKQGGKAIPSVEETAKYLSELEENRKNCKSPKDFDRDEAIKWLVISPKWLVDKSSIAKFLMEKYAIEANFIDKKREKAQTVDMC